MFDGGHVRRRSIDSIIDASPCVRMERRIQTGGHSEKADSVAQLPSVGKTLLVEKPSIASTSSFKFGSERMIKAKKGLLERQSLESSCLIAEGEDLVAERKF